MTLSLSHFWSWSAPTPTPEQELHAALRRVDKECGIESVKAEVNYWWRKYHSANGRAQFHKGPCKPTK